MNDKVEPVIEEPTVHPDSLEGKRARIIERLEKIGVIPTMETAHRFSHVGASDYSTKVIQPWSIWLEYDLDGWEADIIKRVLRTKLDGRDIRTIREEDYKKIKHLCDEKLSHIRAGVDRRCNIQRSISGAGFNPGSKASSVFKESPDSDIGRVSRLGDDMGRDS